MMKYKKNEWNSEVKNKIENMCDTFNCKRALYVQKSICSSGMGSY